MNDNAFSTISFANLITRLVSSERVGEYDSVAIRHPSEAYRYQALSAGPAVNGDAFSELQTYGIPTDELLPKTSGAYERPHYDARFKVPREQEGTFTARMYDAMYRDPIAGLDCDPMPELRERLTKPYWSGIKPPLTLADCEEMSYFFRKPMRQPQEASGQGGQGNKIRIFNLCTLVVTPAVYEKLLASAAFVVLSVEEEGTTLGGRQEGSFKRGGQWFVLANNIGVGP